MRSGSERTGAQFESERMAAIANAAYFEVRAEFVGHGDRQALAVLNQFQPDPLIRIGGAPGPAPDPGRIGDIDEPLQGSRLRGAWVAGPGLKGRVTANCQERGPVAVLLAWLPRRAAISILR
jgi:hypothetical protein